MDVERGNRKDVLTFNSITDQIKEKANHPSVSGTLIVFLILDIAMLVIGIIKKDECPIDHKIPLFLIVGGAVGIVSKLLPFINRKLEWPILNYIIYALYIFEIIWMIVGSVWVYSIYQPNYEFRFRSYCDKTAYLFSFWLLTIRWVLLALSILFGACYCCFASNK